jgi:hypothetical protein
MFDDLELTTNKIYDRYLDKDLHKLFPQLIWEMSLSSNDLNSEELLTELNREDIWALANRGSNLRYQYINGSSVLLDSLNQSFKKFRPQLIDLMFDTNKQVASQAWFMPKDHYLKNCHIDPIIYKDMPGYKMSVHKDNSHIMLQTLFNLSENGSMGTEFFNSNETESFYKGSGGKCKGVCFLNVGESAHIIRDITDVRYILYVAVYMPTWAKQWIGS